MLVILEGPDGAGKSTLATLLLARLAVWRPTETIELLHRGPPRRHPLDEYVSPLLDYRPRTGRSVICDRWHLGELVYPRVLERPTAYDEAVSRYVELFLASRGALVILVDADDETLRERVARRGDDLVDPDRAVAAAAAFRKLSRRLTHTVVPGDRPDAVDLDELLALGEFTEAETARLTTNFTTYVGPPLPSLLLVGDVRATGTAVGDLRPAFMPYPATSGHYLLRSLEADTYERCGLANARDVDDVHRLHAALGRPDVVALGNNALAGAVGLTRRGTAVGAVPHPQFWRRFLHRHSAAYGRLIERASSGEDLRGWRP